MNFNLIKNNAQIVLISLMILSVFVGLSCISAADSDNCTIADNCSQIDINNTATDINTVADDVTDTVADETVNPSIILDKNNDFTMSARYKSGTGYHWVISEESYGVELVSQNNVIDHPGCCGSSGTTYYHFHATSDDFYVKLVCLSPTGKIVDELDTNSMN